MLHLWYISPEVSAELHQVFVGVFALLLSARQRRRHRVQLPLEHTHTHAYTVREASSNGRVDDINKNTVVNIQSVNLHDELALTARAAAAAALIIQAEKINPCTATVAAEGLLDNHYLG